MIGTGHMMRCLTLAEGLRNQNSNCTFICRGNNEAILDRIIQNKFKLYVLPVQAIADKASLVHDEWLGCAWEIDAEQTNNILKDVQPDWLIVDHYSLDSRWEKRLSCNYRKLMVIDDIADRQHICDLLLDQNLFLDMSRRYQDKVPNQCVQLLGPEYALLHPIYAKSRSVVKNRTLPLKNLLVFFGGVDMGNMTGLTLTALTNMDYPFPSIDIVISKHSPNFNEIYQRVNEVPNIQLHSDLPTLSPLMVNADLAIGAGGATSWERLCLGLPSLVITLAENQRKMNQDLHMMGLIRLIGDIDTIKEDEISAGIKEILNLQEIGRWSKQCMEACSGNGVALVIDAMQKIFNR